MGPSGTVENKVCINMGHSGIHMRIQLAQHGLQWCSREIRLYLYGIQGYKLQE